MVAPQWHMMLGGGLFKGLPGKGIRSIRRFKTKVGQF